MRRIPTARRARSEAGREAEYAYWQEKLLEARVSARERARDMLRELLANGPRPESEVGPRGWMVPEDWNIAAAQLGIVKTQRDGVVLWSLPPADGGAVPSS